MFAFSHTCARTFAAITLAATLALTAAPLNAQPQQATVSTRFTALSLDGKVDGIRYDSGGGSHTLWLSKVARTALQRYNGPAQIVFYVPAKGAEGEPIKQTVGTANLANFAGGEALLIFSANKNAPGQYHVFAVDDSGARFPANSWRVFNMTPNPVALKVGDQSAKVINAGQEQLFRFSSSGRDSANIQLATSGTDGWQVARTSIWSHSPQMRTLVFLLPNQSGTGIQVHRVNQPLSTMPSAQ